MNRADLGEGLISCLMVTQAARWRDGEPAGVRSFRQQSHGARELVLVTADPCPAMDDAGFDVIAAPAGTRLGALRQLSVEAASGEYVATWDDDDFSNPDRLTAQLEALEALPQADGCTLLRVMIRDLVNGRHFVGPRASWAMTLLARRESMPRFRPEMTHGEDDDVIFRMPRLVVLDRPDLFTHVVHAGSIAGSTWADEWYRQATCEGGSR